MYLDTSFLVSLYVTDAHSAKASALMNKIELPALLLPLHELELINAIQLRLHRRQIRRKETRESVILFRKDISSGVYFQKPFLPTIFDRAVRMAQKRTPRLGARSLDILHVAAAIELKAKTFYTFDRRQTRLAKSEGLRVLP